LITGEQNKASNERPLQSQLFVFASCPVNLARRNGPGITRYSSYQLTNIFYSPNCHTGNSFYRFISCRYGRLINSQPTCGFGKPRPLYAIQYYRNANNPHSVLVAENGKRLAYLFSPIDRAEWMIHQRHHGLYSSIRTSMIIELVRTIISRAHRHDRVKTIYLRLILTTNHAMSTRTLSDTPHSPRPTHQHAPARCLCISRFRLPIS